MKDFSDFCTCKLDGIGEACPIHGDIQLSPETMEEITECLRMKGDS